MAKNVHVSHDQLVTDIRAGTIDTVLAVFGDHAGRLVGKRTDAEFYLDVVHEEGTENCDYLIACDLDNNPIPGFRWASYDQGYGDMRGVVDESTVRYLPWIEKTALVLVDLVDVDTVELLTSEVVTNALVHARSAPELLVDVRPDVVRVEVFDMSADEPVLQPHNPDGASGRGIAIVEELAAGWGVELVPEDGKRVWFEVRT